MKEWVGGRAGRSADGRSVVLYTALGPETGARHAIGRALGDIQGALIERAVLRRAVIAGGDTSSHALRRLGVYALTTRLLLPTTPGSPLVSPTAMRGRSTGWRLPSRADKPEAMTISKR